MRFRNDAAGRNCCFSSLEEDNHYVAFLSNGAADLPRSNSWAQLQPDKQRRRIRFSKLATVIGIAVLLSLIFGGCITWFSYPSNDLAASGNRRAAVKAASARPAAIGGSLIEAFEEFMAKYGKLYATEAEKDLRLSTFIKNVNYINLHNKQNFTYTLAVNAFADLTYEEFKERRFAAYKSPSPDHFLKATDDPDSSRIDWSILNVDVNTLPLSVNWKERGCVSDVLNQKKCGSCWAFSAVGAMEGAHCAKHGVLISLSEQQLVDCSGPEGNTGCNGGDMDDAYQYVMDHGGLCDSRSYPYTAHDGKCRDDQCNSVVKVLKFADVPRKNDHALAAALALRGPVAVAIQADQVPFQFYHSGVFDASCGTALDHGVLAVGYGTEDGKDYWLVKNSWGPEWGSGGYIKMLRHIGSRNNSGQCGILLEPSYPIVD